MPAQAYPLPLPGLKILLAGVDRTGEVEKQTLDIRLLLGNQVSTAAFSMKTPEVWRGGAQPHPVVGQSIAIQTQASPGAAFTTLFAGTIQAVADKRIGYKTVGWDLSCVDHTHQLTRVLVNAVYQNQLAS